MFLSNLMVGYLNQILGSSASPSPSSSPGVLEGAVSEAADIKNAEEAISWLKRITPDIMDYLLVLGRKLLIALVIFFIGRQLIKWLKRILDRSFHRSNMDLGVAKFLLSMISIVLNIFLVIIVIGILGVETSSFAAVIGSAGLTLGLALQGSLSNFAGGVLILIMKPFRIGDYIITQNLEGTVTSIDIFYTRLLTVDNRKVVIPNGGLSNSSIVNVTNEEIRRLDLIIPVAYDCNIKEVKAVLEKLLDRQELILTEEMRNIYVDGFMDSSISIGIRVWTKKEDYWDLKWKLLEEIKEDFDRNHIGIPFNQLDITIRDQGNN